MTSTVLPNDASHQISSGFDVLNSLYVTIRGALVPLLKGPSLCVMLNEVKGRSLNNWSGWVRCMSKYINKCRKYEHVKLLQYCAQSCVLSNIAAAKGDILLRNFSKCLMAYCSVRLRQDFPKTCSWTSRCLMRGIFVCTMSVMTLDEVGTHRECCETKALETSVLVAAYFVYRFFANLDGWSVGFGVPSQFISEID